MILDFTAVNALDVTAAQALIDLRNQFNRYTDPDIVEWHFAGVSNRWTRRALVASGFGADRKEVIIHNPSTTDAEKGGLSNAAESEPLLGAAEASVPTAASSTSDSKGNVVQAKTKDVDITSVGGGEFTPVRSTGAAGKRLVPVYGVNRPYFNVDVETAVTSVVRHLEGRGADSSGRE